MKADMSPRRDKAIGEINIIPANRKKCCSSCEESFSPKQKVMNIPKYEIEYGSYKKSNMYLCNRCATMYVANVVRGLHNNLQDFFDWK